MCYDTALGHVPYAGERGKRRPAVVSGSWFGGQRYCKLHAGFGCGPWVLGRLGALHCIPCKH